MKLLRNNKILKIDRFQDFLNVEVNESTYQTIVFFLNSPHITGVYEGNAYLLVKKKDSNKIVIIDEAYEEFGANKYGERIEIEKKDLLYSIEVFSQKE